MSLYVYYTPKKLGILYGLERDLDGRTIHYRR